MQNITTCLWFESAALDAATHYTQLFPNSRITEITRLPEGGPGPAGSVMAVSFVLDGVQHLALNGARSNGFTTAVSLMAHTDSQAETDRLWDGLLDGGGKPSQCGWLTDRFGVSWQIAPRGLIQLLASGDRAKSQRAFAAMKTMTKLDLPAMQRAFDGV